MSQEARQPETAADHRLLDALQHREEGSASTIRHIRGDRLLELLHEGHITKCQHDVGARFRDDWEAYNRAMSGTSAALPEDSVAATADPLSAWTRGQPTHTQTKNPRRRECPTGFPRQVKAQKPHASDTFTDYKADALQRFRRVQRFVTTLPKVQQVLLEQIIAGNVKLGHVLKTCYGSRTARYYDRARADLSTALDQLDNFYGLTGDAN